MSGNGSGGGGNRLQTMKQRQQAGRHLSSLISSSSQPLTVQPAAQPVPSILPAANTILPSAATPTKQKFAPFLGFNAKPAEVSPVGPKHFNKDKDRKPRPKQDRPQLVMGAPTLFGGERAPSRAMSQTKSSAVPQPLTSAATSILPQTLKDVKAGDTTIDSLGASMSLLSPTVVPVVARRDGEVRAALGAVHTQAEQTQIVHPLFSEDQNDRLVLMQLPSRLPINPTTQSSSTPTQAPAPSQLHQVPAGYAGKIRVRKSGKIELVLGDVVYDIVDGAETFFKEEAVAFDATKKEGYVLGSVEARLVCVPDLNRMTQDQNV
eukprot:c17309_g1_i2.p1 GENE.c17309_g1_i2~~c17309_g1_i2.p1  ORF type:complete len:320 (-),score=52.00 c17309_g1_i2:150-1109(-)